MSKAEELLKVLKSKILADSKFIEYLKKHLNLKCQESKVLLETEMDVACIFLQEQSIYLIMNKVIFFVISREEGEIKIRISTLNDFTMEEIIKITDLISKILDNYDDFKKDIKDLVKIGEK